MTHRTSTRNRFYLSCYILLFLFLSFYSCRQEGVNKPKHDLSMEMAYPQMLGKDPRIQHIIRELRAMDHQTRLAQKFVDVQATPLWDCGILAEKGIDTLLFVPIQSKRTPEEIQTIWTFYIHGDTTFTYSFYHSNEVQDEDLWRFDYFTTFALGKTPKSGARFTTPEGQQIPRYGYYVENCVTNYYYAGPPPVTRWIPRTRCWTAFLQSGADGSNPDDQNTGGGGGTPPTGSRPIPGSGGGGGNGGSPNPAPTPTPEPLKGHFDKIDKTKEFEGSRTDSMYKKLGSVGDLLQILQEGFVGGKNSKGDLKLVLAHLSPQRPFTITLGETTPRGRLITVTFDVIFMKHLHEARLAATVLHEMVHAWVWLQRNTLSEKELKKKYPDLVPRFGHEGFMRYKEKFIDVLFSLYGSELTKDQCEALFWEGVEQSEPWIKLQDSLKVKFQELSKGIKNRQ